MNFWTTVFDRLWAGRDILLNVFLILVAAHILVMALCAYLDSRERK